MMGKRLYRDIEIHGRVYPTLQAAAAHFGCTAQNIANQIKAGRTHRIGAGRQKIEPCLVRIRGVDYASAREAGAALGVTAAAVWRALTENRADTVGLGPRCPNPHLSRPYSIAGLSWPSMRAAEVALGLSDGMIGKTLRRNSRAGKERIMSAVMRHKAAAENRAMRAAYRDPAGDPASVPAGPAFEGGRYTITICGRTWPSAAALSQALGRNESYVSEALRFGRRGLVVEKVKALLVREAGETSSQRGRGTSRAEGAGWARDRAA